MEDFSVALLSLAEHKPFQHSVKPNSYASISYLKYFLDQVNVAFITSAISLCGLTYRTEQWIILEDTYTKWLATANTCKWSFMTMNLFNPTSMLSIVENPVLPERMSCATSSNTIVPPSDQSYMANINLLPPLPPRTDTTSFNYIWWVAPDTSPWSSKLHHRDQHLSSTPGTIYFHLQLSM